MKILIVNPYVNLLYEKKKLLKIEYPDSEIITFTNPMLAVKYAVNNRVDFLYTRVDMNICNGYQVAELVVKFNKVAKVYFDEK